jgi:dipeptidase E
MKQRQIFAIGGRFYVDAWEPPLLQRHLLSLSSARSPRICLLAGAVGDNPTAIEQFYREIGIHNCRPTHLNIYKPVTRDFADYFTTMDIIYVNGGSTRNLVTVWRDWGIDKALRGVWEQGVVMSGTSAGMNCWFEACITDSYPPEMLPLSCIGLLSGSACAHYTKRPDRAPTFRRMIAEAKIPGPGYAADDDVALHFIGNALHEAVSAGPRAGAWRLEGGAEQSLPIRLLAV